MRNLGLCYVGFESPDVKAWPEFGAEVLGMGLMPTGADESSVYLRMDDRHHRIAIHPGQRNRLTYIGWELPDKAAFEEGVEELRRAGQPVELGTEEQLADRFVLGMARVQDPCGFTHEICFGHGAEWRSFIPGRAHGGFVTGDQGLGHVVLVGPEHEAFDAFVTDHLGLERLVYTQVPGVGGLGFYRAGARQHSLALAGFPKMRGVQHLMIQCNDLDDVGFAWDMCKRRGHPVPIDLGRHRGDFMLSFYVETPSGFYLEYGWGGARAEETGSMVGRGWRDGDPGSYWGHHTTNGRPQAFMTPPTVETLTD